jgi:hypothetical protein
MNQSKSNELDRDTGVARLELAATILYWKRNSKRDERQHIQEKPTAETLRRGELSEIVQLSGFQDCFESCAKSSLIFT